MEHLFKICALIPARYGSTRLNGKPLLKIAGETIISRTFLQTKKSKYIDKVYVVTDDERIKDEIVKTNNGDDSCVIIVKDECVNGTERICKALEKEGISNEYDLIVNIQGDEPFINPNMIDYMIEKHLQNSNNDNIVCTTIHTKIHNKDYLYNTSFGKMVIDNYNDIIYCSRTLIPSNKKGEIIDGYSYLTHIGIFIFKRWFLKKYMNHPDTPLQLMEDIEWLKIIEMGYKIKSFEVEEECEIGVNTIDDYNYLIAKYGQ